MNLRHGDAHVSHFQRNTRTAQNVVVPTAEAHYLNVQQIVRSGFDPEVTARMQREAIALLTTHKTDS